MQTGAVGLYKQESDFGRQKSELLAILEQYEENGILTQYMVLGHLASQTELSHHYMDSKKVARTAKKLRGRQKSGADSKKVGPNAGGDLKCW
jgi:hypothetical protein